MIFPVRKTLSGRRAVVIGSGPGGLSAAISLAVRGARVIVLEKSADIGPTFRAVPLGEQSFEQSLSPVFDPQVLVELFASADQRTTDFVALHRRNPIARFLFADQSHFDLPHEKEQLEEQVTRLDAQDGKRFVAFLRECRGIAGGLQTFRRVRAITGNAVWSHWRFARAAGEIINPLSFRMKVNRAFRSEKVRAMLMSLRVLSGISPGAPAAFSQDFLARLQELGGWHVEGGGEAMLTALLRLCELLGVKFAAGANVERIELEGGRVRRVSGEGFKTVAASIVVSNSEPFERLGRFLPKLDALELPIKRAWKHPKAPSYCTLLAHVGQRHDQLAARTVVVSADPTEESRFVDAWKIPAASPSLVVENVSQENTPAGETLLAVRAAVPPASTRFQWSESEANEFRARMISALEEAGLAKLNASIKESHFVSPASPEMDALPFSGDMGYDVSSYRLLSRIPRNRVAQIPGLYLASGYAFPGPGFVNELLSGMIAAVCASEDAL